MIHTASLAVLGHWRHLFEQAREPDIQRQSRRSENQIMTLPLAVARQFHRVFPFSQLRTANWILKNNRNKELSPVRLFGYEVPL